MARLDLTGMPLSKAILRMALPTSVGYFFQTLYNLTDNYWAKFLGESAVAGMGATFPIFLLMLAITFGVSQGATVLCAHAMGAKNETRAARLLNQALILGLIGSVVLVVIGLPLLPLLLSALSSSPDVARQGYNYFAIILVFNVAFMLSFTINGGLTAIGDTITLAIALIGSTILNLALDPLFIFGLTVGDLVIIPKMDLFGIGLATVVSQSLAFAFIFYRLTRSSYWAQMIVQPKLPEMPIIKELLSQGVPAMLNMMAVSIGFILMLYFIKPFGDAAQAGFSAGLRIEQLVLLPAVGLNSAAIAIIGQNMGAGQPARAIRGFQLCMIYALIILNLGAVLVFVFAYPLMSLFAPNNAVLQHGFVYLRFISLEYAALCLVMIGGGFLQATKHPRQAMFITMIRLVVLPLILMPLFSTTLGWGYSGVWIAILVGSYCFGIATIFVCNRIAKREFGQPIYAWKSA